MKNEMPIMKGNFAVDKFNYILSHCQLLLELDTSKIKTNSKVSIIARMTKYGINKKKTMWKTQLTST